MDYQIPRRTGAMAPTASRLPASGYLNASMTLAVSLAFLGEGFRLSGDPVFAVGGALAGVTVAVGLLGLIVGGSSLIAILRQRRRGA